MKLSKKKKKQPNTEIGVLPEEDKVRLNSFRQIDALVEFFKRNSNELNAVTENWVRRHITSREYLEYYKTKMQKEVWVYRSVVFRLLNMSSVGDKIRREVRIDKFKKSISNIINNKLERGAKRTSPMYNREPSFDLLKKKEWLLDWNCVLFKRGSVVIYSRSDLGFKFSPTTVYAPQSIESFNYLKKYLNERLPPIRCIIEGLKLTVVDKINFSSAIERFASAARQGVIRSSGNSNINLGPRPMSFQQALSKAKQMTPEEFKKYKSEYIDYLVNEQSKNYKVIPCVERLAHTVGDTTEYAFMFSIECRSGDVLIVHENVNPDRSTLLFIVKRENYDNAIRAIYNFLQSAEINKRSSLRNKDIDKGEVGIERYRSINHDALYSWQNEIMSYKFRYSNDFLYH